jgi:hypothetical protein
VLSHGCSPKFSRIHAAHIRNPALAEACTHRFNSVAGQYVSAASRKGHFSFNPADLPDFRPLDAYGLIGDNHTAVLVGADGSMDWACLPDFDSPSLFGALLDPTAGRFAIRPRAPSTP